MGYPVTFSSEQDVDLLVSILEDRYNWVIGEWRSLEEAIFEVGTPQPSLTIQDGESTTAFTVRRIKHETWGQAHREMCGGWDCADHQSPHRDEKFNAEPA